MRTKWRTRIGLLLVGGFSVGAMSGAPVALAQATDDPSAAQYDPPIPDPGTASSAASGSGLEGNIGWLPLTGLDLLIVLGVALLLTGTGVALRRLSMPPPRA